MSPRKKTNKKKFKLKTHKATAKRFKVTGGGKIMRTKGHKGHFRRRKSKRVKRKLGLMFEVAAAGHRRRIRKLAPNLGQK